MRLFPIGAALALASFAGCRKQESRSQLPRSDSAIAVDTMTTIPVSAMRESLSVSLHCGDGKVVEFKDTAFRESDGGRWHLKLDSVFSDSGWFVQRIGYEEEELLYIAKKDCRRLRLSGDPVFNPSRTRFAAVEVWEIGDSYSQIHLVGWENGVARIEKGMEWRDGYLSEWKWTNDSDFFADFHSYGSPPVFKPFKLGLRGGKWNLDSSSAWIPDRERMQGGDSAGAADGLPFPEAADSAAPE